MSDWDSPPYGIGAQSPQGDLAQRHQGLEAQRFPDPKYGPGATVPTDNQLAARVYNSAGTALVDSTWTTLNFDTIERQVGREFTQPPGDRFTIQRQGWYVLSLGVTFAANATGNRGLRLYDVTHSLVIAEQMQPATAVADTDRLHLATFEFFLANTVLYAQAYQSSGGSLLTVAEDRQSPLFSVGYVNISV